MSSPEPMKITESRSVAGELVVVTVDLNERHITMCVAVESLGVTWVSNTKKAIGMGMSLLWETIVEDVPWVLWSRRRGVGGWEWHVARDIFVYGYRLPGEVYAPEAMVAASKYLLNHPDHDAEHQGR